jgi:primary-amine oxidase
VNKDLVARVNMDNLHIPRAEDGPLTLTYASRSSFVITPFNYFDEADARDIQNSAYIAFDTVLFSFSGIATDY